VLIGRDAEQARIATVLEQARAGRASVLVLRGEPGVGKTSLLDAAIQRATGFGILTTTGVQSERELPFAGVHALLQPLLDEVDGLPGPQAVALRSALAIGPSSGGDAFATYAAVLGLLANAAATEPILVVVDDVQFLDRSSAEALGFAFRRLRDETIAVVLGLRTEEVSAFDVEGLPAIDIEPLPGSDAVALLGAAAPDIAGQAQRRILALARGNPLALVELPRLLAADPAAPGGVQGDLPRASALLSRAFGRRIEALPESARLAVVVAAAEEESRVETVTRACRSLGVQIADLEAAEAAGILRIRGDRLEFRHPLVRAVAYADASAALRRSAHRALADALEGHATKDRWAWHSALASVEPDDTIADALEDIGRRTLDASPDAAQAAFEEAARMSSGPQDRSRRLFGAARAAEASGRLAVAETLAESAGALASDELHAAEVAHLVGRVRVRLGDATAVDALTDAAGRAAAVDPERAALMFAEAVDVAVETDFGRAKSIARSAWQLAWPRGGKTEQLVTLRYADTLGYRGDARSTALWRRVGELASPDDPERLRLAAEGLFSAGDDAEASEMATRAIALARSRSALNVLTQSLEFLALSESRRGRLQAGLDAITECLDLLYALRQPREELYAHGAAAWIAGSLGLEVRCREHVRRSIEIGQMLGQTIRTGAALGILELSLGHAAAAAESLLERAGEIGERIAGNAIATRPIVPTLVEALVRAGRRAEALSFLPPFEAVAERSERPLVIAFAQRMRALVDDSTDRLAAAVELFARADNRYEQARTELLLGETLRRERQRGAARKALRAAVEGFDGVGASGWADRARAELAATGETVRREQVATSELTPQERVVARLVAQGLTNKQIAEQLFLSPNTIESHLRHIFQKADVRTRTQLAHVLGAEA
jgi:DNA-binding CsgD family transcriptional regulator